jgi:hypothetical protein
LILAIDPGNIESAYVVLDENLKPIIFGKVPNNNLLEMIVCEDFDKCNRVAIEMIASYGMAVGKEVFDTCVWIGKFHQALDSIGIFEDISYIYRKDEKINLCGNMKAKDGNISMALRDRFGQKGTKDKPGWFYGVSKDVWQAIAVGVTYSDMYLKNKKDVG